MPKPQKQRGTRVGEHKTRRCVCARGELSWLEEHTMRVTERNDFPPSPKGKSSKSSPQTPPQWKQSSPLGFSGFSLSIFRFAVCYSKASSATSSDLAGGSSAGDREMARRD